jgi:hypothetical protein
MREEDLIRRLGLNNNDTGHLAESRAIAPVAAIQKYMIFCGTVADPKAPSRRMTTSTPGGKRPAAWTHRSRQPTCG